MAFDVDKIAEKMDALMDQAADAEEMDQTLFYGQKAICVGLTAILMELRSIRNELSNR